MEKERASGVLKWHEWERDYRADNSSDFQKYGWGHGVTEAYNSIDDIDYN
jgi:hypothetical protein